METILDLGRYPLGALDSEAGRALVARCQDDLKRDGMFNLDGLVRPEAVTQIAQGLSPILDTRAFTHARRHNIYFKPEVEGLSADHPALTEFETVNHTICADQMADTVLIDIYEFALLAAFLAAVMDKPALHVMADPLARVNVMRYHAGEALNWHFDRSEFTTTLLLQAPAAGGVFQYATDLRTDEDPRYEDVARLVRGDWPVEEMRLTPGTLNVFKGRNTAHRVSPIEGEVPRMIAVFSYYDRPGVQFSESERLGFYGRAA